MWILGSYDAELNLAFFGPTQTYDTGPDRNSIGAPGVINESLYTDSTMALDPDTGKISTGRSNASSSSCRCSDRAAPCS